ncbi:hypothetical protein QJQ45_022403, partial [Haematococcus lacustris]
MGITGLLPILEPITRERHLRSYRGKRVAVDAYAWLYKGAYACSKDLFLGNYTDKCAHSLYQTNTVVDTFAGVYICLTKAKKRELALTNITKGNLADARKCMQQCVAVTPAMAKQFIEALKEVGVEFVVAPYEADAQMAYLALNGDVWAVVSDDSDLLAYGCPRVLYKLDKMGNGEEICLENLPLNKEVSFADFSHAMFQQVCDSLRLQGTAVPRDYEERFQLALWVFRHQRVFCKDLQGCTHLRPLPPGGIGMADVDVPSAVPQPAALPTQQGRDTQSIMFDLQQAALSDPLAFLGPWLPDSIAQGLAAGDLDPSTLKPYDLAKVYAGARNMP